MSELSDCVWRFHRLPIDLVPFVVGVGTFVEFFDDNKATDLCTALYAPSGVDKIAFDVKGHLAGYPVHFLFPRPSLAPPPPSPFSLPLALYVTLTISHITYLDVD